MNLQCDRARVATAPLFAVRILGVDARGNPIEPLAFTTVGRPESSAA